MNHKNENVEREDPGLETGHSERMPVSLSPASAAEDLGKVLASLYRYSTLYPSSHPSIKETTERFFKALGVYFQETDRVRVGFLGKDLVVLGKHLYRIEGSIPGLNRLFQEQGIEKICFNSGLDGEEIIQFFSALSAQSKSGGVEEVAWTALDHGKWPHISVGQFSTEGTVVDLTNSGAPLNLDEAREVKDFLDACHGLVSQIQEKKIIEFNLASEIIENILSGIILEDHAVPIVAQIKQHDEYTFTHILNASTLSLAMGRVLGFSPPQLRELGLAALLHDTGKVLIPKEILQKEGGLSDEEFNVIRMHPVHGAGLLMKIKELPDLVPIVAFEHHLQFDGGGYPRVHRDYKPHLCSRITSIADIFDALRTNRAYREEVPKENTLQRMSTMEVDPFLFNLFARIANLYSVGEAVRLDTHEIGVVHEINPQNAFRPTVKILFNAENDKVQDRRIVNLNNFDKRKNRFICSIIDKVPDEELAKLA